MSQKSAVQAETGEGFVTSYIVELLFAGHPYDDLEEIVAMLAEFEKAPVDHETGLTLIRKGDDWNPDTTPRWVIAPDVRPWSEHRYHEAIGQSWSWAGAEDALNRCGSSWLVADRRATRLPFRERLELFQTVLGAAVRVMNPRALHWSPTEQLVDPTGLTHAIAAEGSATLFGAINIRLFRIDEYEDGEPLETPEMIMDTLGLSALGLDDLQVHFRNLEPQDVGHFLYNAAHFIFEKGAVIKGGDTLRGTDGHPWKCEYENALVEPDRVVIDFNPGEEYAGGNR
ncbi:MAG: DUF4261 domain-containing protein [Thermoanaerobaculia bacterium]|nr:DUF4261 domain-containing protein [Thermoanaerobaculia bacterium]